MTLRKSHINWINSVANLRRNFNNLQISNHTVEIEGESYWTFKFVWDRRNNNGEFEYVTYLVPTWFFHGPESAVLVSDGIDTKY